MPDQLFPDPVADAEKAEERAGVDLGDGFPVRVGPDQRVVDRVTKQEARKLEWEYHCEAFTVFRPWESCTRCKEQIMNGSIVLTDDGDHVCPHTNRRRYEGVVNAAREREKAILGRSSFVTLKDGTMVAQVEWWQYQGKQGKEKRDA